MSLTPEGATMAGSKTVLVVVDDLFFTVKIGDAVKRAGMQPLFVKTEQGARDRLAERPALVIVDLNCTNIDSVRLISEIRSGEFRSTPLVGFVSHVQVELKQKARDAGCEIVLARSALSDQLPQILSRYTG